MRLSPAIFARRRTHRRAGAFSLVEMMAATALLAGTLAPALAVMRDAMALSRQGVKRQLVANYATLLLEGASNIQMRVWFPTTYSGNCAAYGNAAIRYSATMTDAPAGGGLTGQLMHITITAYYDDNANSAMDATEIRTTYRTKISKLTSYQNVPM
jgi:type II secretory pathway pseudopilin PulG